MSHETRKRRLALGLCQTCGKVPHEAGRSNCRPCADVQLARVKARDALRKAMLKENGGKVVKPLRKTETDEQTAKAIEQRMAHIRAIRQWYWRDKWSVAKIALELRGRYSETWIRDCAYYKFEKAII